MKKKKKIRLLFSRISACGRIALACIFNPWRSYTFYINLPDSSCRPRGTANSCEPVHEVTTAFALCMPGIPKLLPPWILPSSEPEQCLLPNFAWVLCFHCSAHGTMAFRLIQRIGILVMVLSLHAWILGEVRRISPRLPFLFLSGDELAYTNATELDYSTSENWDDLDESSLTICV